MLNTMVINPYIIPGIPNIRLDSDDLIFTPSLVEVLIEREFRIPGLLWYKNRSPRYSIARFIFIYILQEKMKITPEIIRAIYGTSHCMCNHAMKTISNILDTKTPRHYYIIIDKIVKKIKKWDISEIILKLELRPAKNATAEAYRKNTLELSTRRAISTRQEPVLAAEVLDLLKLPGE